MTRLTVRSVLLAASAFATPIVARAQSASAPAAAQPAGKTPNFSGTWELNVAKSSLGESGPTKGTMTLTQAGDRITRVSAMSSPMGDITNTMHHAVGASTTDTITVVGQKLPFTSTARWEGTTLVVDGRVLMQEMPVPVVGRFTLSPDGKQLTVDQVVSTPMGEQTTRFVYDKKA